MELLIKQRVFSFRNSFDIYNAAQQPVYHAKGQVFSLGHKLRLFDMQDNEIAYIKQRIFTLRPTFDLYHRGQYLAQIRKNFSLSTNNYRFPDSTLFLEGDFFAHNYRLMDSFRHIMQVSKKWFSWGDTYLLNIERPEDTELGLIVMLAVDCAMAPA